MEEDESSSLSAASAAAASDSSHLLVCSRVPLELRAPEKLEEWLIRKLGSGATSTVQLVRWHDDETSIVAFVTPSAASAALLRLCAGFSGMGVSLCDAAFKKRHERLVGPLPGACRPDADMAVAARFIRAAIGGSRRAADAASNTPASSQAAFLKPTSDYFLAPQSRAEEASSWRSGAPRPPSLVRGADGRLIPLGAGGGGGRERSWRSSSTSASMGPDGSAASRLGSPRAGSGSGGSGGGAADMLEDAASPSRAAAGPGSSERAPTDASARHDGGGGGGDGVVRGRGTVGSRVKARGGIADDDADWSSGRRSDDDDDEPAAVAAKPLVSASRRGADERAHEASRLERRKAGAALAPGAAARLFASSGLVRRK